MNTTALWLHRPPKEIPANHDYLRRALKGLAQPALDVGRGRFNNVRCLVKRALAAAGVPTPDHVQRPPLTAAWKSTRERITDSYTQECLARFMAFCSAKGISPEVVDDKTVEEYLRTLVDEDLTARPYVAVQSAVRLWNRQTDHDPGWPRQRLTQLLRRQTYTLRWNQLPSGFVADVEQYLAILAGIDPTDPLSAPRPLKPLSIKTRRYQILQFVSALHHQDVDVKDLHGLADLCRVDLVRKALQFFIKRHRQRHGEDADVTTSMIGGIADAIRCIAKHYVKVPEDVMCELSRISARPNRRARVMTDKTRTRLAQLDPPLALRRLLLHAQTEMKKLASKRNPSRLDAVRYSVLLAIEILLHAPMRIENLAELDRERHFVWPPRNRGDICITIPRSAVKNSQPLDYKIPAGAAHAIYVYLERFRPLLTTQDSSAIFPNWHGRSKRQDTLSKQIIRLLRAELNITWNPHLFRHLAVRIYLRAHPGDYEGARRLLAHLSGETTYRFYEGEEMRPAVDEYDRLLEELRGPVSFSAAHPLRRRSRSNRGRS